MASQILRRSFGLRLRHSDAGTHGGGKDRGKEVKSTIRIKKPSLAKESETAVVSTSPVKKKKDAVGAGRCQGGIYAFRALYLVSQLRTVFPTSG